MEVIACQGHMAEGSSQEDMERMISTWEEGAAVPGFGVGITAGPVDDAGMGRSGVVQFNEDPVSWLRWAHRSGVN